MSLEVRKEELLFERAQRRAGLNECNGLFSTVDWNHI